jgi:hypothetical protein
MAPEDIDDTVTGLRDLRNSPRADRDIDMTARTDRMNSIGSRGHALSARLTHRT